MIFLRRLVIITFAFVGFSLGIVLGVHNAQSVSFSFLLFTLPTMPIGLLVIVSLALGICIGYISARCMQLFNTKKPK